MGASDNDRVFAATASLSSGGIYVAIPGDNAASAPVTTAPMVDVATLDGDGMACSGLPADSLRGSIALILRGICTFEQKLDNAQQAGAIAALVYTDQARPDPVPMTTGAATLPGEMVSYSDGIGDQAEPARRGLGHARFLPAPELHFARRH